MIVFLFLGIFTAVYLFHLNKIIYHESRFDIKFIFWTESIFII